MSNIPTEIVDDIRSHSRIEDVIGHYINVMKKGSNYVAYCPFHDDHDPSLHISVDKQIFKCFSCPAEEGSAGDVFKFVMKYKHVEYPEAIRIVAEMIGYKYDFGDRNTPVFEETVTHRINRDTVDFCMHELNAKEGVLHKEYLNKRHLDNNILEKFEIGYNPNNNMLYNFLVKKGYKDSDIIAANLARLTNMGIRDVFYDRIMIPICDGSGHPIGFTARSIDPNNEAKYINSSDTPVFSKSNVLFNLHRAKEGAREKKYIILAEGPMDVIAFDRAGLHNAVCSLGTATTKNQLSILRRITATLLLAFDGDKAGQGAILRTGRLAEELGFKVVVINNQTKYDPDEIINQYGANELVNMVDKPLTWIEFIMSHYEKQYDLNNYSSKKEYAQKVLEEIRKLKDEFDRNNYLQQLSQLTGFSVSLLGNEIPDQQQDQHKVVKTAKVEKVVHTGMELAQKSILKQMLLSKKSTDFYKQELGKLPEEQMNNLALKIVEYYDQSAELKIPNFVGSLSENSQIQLVYEILENDLYGQEEVNEALLQDAVLEIKIDDLRKQVEESKKLASTLSDPVVIGKVATEQVTIQNKINVLKKMKSKRK